MKVLGLDVGNAKLKLCLIDSPGNLDQALVVWDSLAIPFTANRPQDFEQGLPLNLALFSHLNDVLLESLDAIVVCSSQAYSYPVFHLGVTHLAQVLQDMIPDVPIYFVRADGQMTLSSELLQFPPEELYGYVLTNFFGSAYLGSKMIKNGLALDIGTTTTDIIPIVDGQIDPVGLAQPHQYLAFRSEHYRLNWLGLTVIPLVSLAERVCLGSRSYQMVGRDYRTELVFAVLGQVHPDLMSRHAYGHLFPEPEDAARRLAQLTGLDAFLHTPEEVIEIAQFFYDRLVTRVSEAIQKVTEQTFGGSESLDVAVFALGEQALAQPALLKAGFKIEQLRFLQYRRNDDLWSASSVFAMALKGLEHLVGHAVALPD